MPLSQLAHVEANLQGTARRVPGLPLAEIMICRVALILGRDLTSGLDQIVGNADVADIPGCEPNDRWTSQNVRQDMDFCGLTTARRTDGLRLHPPLPPWAERCALT